MNRRAIAGLCLIASAALHLASSVFWPAGSEGSATDQLGAAAAHPGAMAAASLTDLLGWLLLLPALTVLWHEVRGRGSVLVGIGAWGTMLTVLGSVGGAVLNLVTADLGRSAGGLAVFRSIKDDGLVGAVVVLPFLLGLVALVVLLGGAARAGLGGWWLPVAGAIAVVADQMTAESENPLITATAYLPMAAALVAVAVRLMSARTAPVTGSSPVPAAA